MADEKILRGRKGAERDPVCICGVVIEEESVCPSDAQRKEERARQRRRRRLFMCVSVFSGWWQNKRPPLSCTALRILRGFRAPSAQREGEGVVLRLSSELPVCLFPHRRLPNRRVLHLSHGSGPSQPPASFDLLDRRRKVEGAFAVCVCSCERERERDGGSGQKGSKANVHLYSSDFSAYIRKTNSCSILINILKAVTITLTSRFQSALTMLMQRHVIYGKK